MTYKSEDQERLYRACISLVHKMPEGYTFSFKELKQKSGVQCNTNDQREAGRRFAFLAKHTSLPVVIVDSNSPIVYEKI